jgi:threonine dehydrogenase-like Zn-dependent dehydrogenase
MSTFNQKGGAKKENKNADAEAVINNKIIDSLLNTKSKKDTQKLLDLISKNKIKVDPSIISSLIQRREMFDIIGDD